MIEIVKKESSECKKTALRPSTNLVNLDYEQKNESSMTKMKNQKIVIE